MYKQIAFKPTNSYAQLLLTSRIKNQEPFSCSMYASNFLRDAFFIFL